MIQIIKVFGWISIAVGGVCVALGIFFFLINPMLLTVGISSVLSGAILIAFAKTVEILEHVDRGIARIHDDLRRLLDQIAPVHIIAKNLADKYQPSESRQKQAFFTNSGTYPRKTSCTFQDLSTFPSGTTFYESKGARLALLPNQIVVVDGAAGEVEFSSPAEFRWTNDDKDEWKVLGRV